MRKISTTFGLTGLLMTGLLTANALTVQFEVGPGNIKTQPYNFDIASRDRDGIQQFNITITQKKGELSPGLSARLHLSDGKTEIAAVPLEETREGGKVTYWFQVAPGLLAKSRFEFDVFSGIVEKLPNGKTRFIAEPGTLEYWFNLRDFPATKTAQKPLPETGGRTCILVGDFF